MRAFSFCSANFFLIFVTGKREVSAVPTRYFEQYVSIFVFDPKFFLISRIGERDVSTVTTWCPEQYASIFGSNFFFDI